MLLSSVKAARGVRAVILLVLLVGAIFDLTACSRATQHPVAPVQPEQVQFADDLGSSNFSSVYASTLSTACVECHNPSGMATVNYNVQLNFMNKTAAFTSLTESSVNGATSAGTCGPVKIVVPGQPANSYLIGTLIQRYANGNFGGVGGCTPYAGHYSIINLTSSQQTGLVGWVQDGALDN